MPEETVWALEHHTKAKHEILRRYLGAWFPILAARGWNRRVVFLDGFAGPGVYEHGEPGSPIIALDTLVNHAHFGRLQHTEFAMLFVEKDEARSESLVEEIDAFWDRQGGKPDNVRVVPVNDEFTDAAESLVKTLEEQQERLAPTFAFIDPFGWSGVPLETISRLLAYDKCEVFFTFMYDSVNRWVAHPNPGVRRHLRELFGTDAYHEADGRSSAERKHFLHDLYRDQLRAVGGFDHVHSFEMIDRGRTLYSLFFGTRSIDGVRVMKDAMWAVDPVDGLRFSDRLGSQSVLFTPDPDPTPLRDAILEHFAGQTVNVEDIERFVLTETPYKASHYKKQVLKPLQQEGLIEAVSGQNRRGTFPEETVLRFATDGA